MIEQTDNLMEKQMKQTYGNYMKEYWKSNCKRISIVLHNEKDADIIRALDGKNMQATAKELMRAGIESKK
ncbi:hypothetical protein [Methanobrevibacter sp.]|uniref:hypothetical protein n=1 Tax=Methanobrevibacter sp. TaxID=66852 RepID=UPI00388F5777